MIPRLDIFTASSDGLTEPENGFLIVTGFHVQSADPSADPGIVRIVSRHLFQSRYLLGVDEPPSRRRRFRPHSAIGLRTGRGTLQNALKQEIPHPNAKDETDQEEEGIVFSHLNARKASVYPRRRRRVKRS
jgi:hypothetical protein